MDSRSILKRIELLEMKYKRVPLIVLAENEQGELIKIDALKLDTNKNLRFCKVLNGSDLRGLEAVLRTIARSVDDK